MRARSWSVDMEIISCVALCGAAAYGCRSGAAPLTSRLTALRLRRRKAKEGARLRAIVESKARARSPPGRVLLAGLAECDAGEAAT